MIMRQNSLVFRKFAFFPSMKNSHVKKHSGVVDPQQLQRAFLLHLTIRQCYNTKLNWGILYIRPKGGALERERPIP